MARATRVRLYEREVREKLSGPAVEILLDRARLLSEGARSRSPTAGQAFFGSIMLTIDLALVAEAVCERCDEATAARLADMMSSDARVLRRVRQMAEREASRLAGGPITIHTGDVRFRADGARVFVDIDVEE
jgi:hypothetical protein